MPWSVVKWWPTHGRVQPARSASSLRSLTPAQFTYINGAFAPTPDDTVGNLYKCFGTEGHLIVNYSWVIPYERH